MTDRDDEYEIISRVARYRRHPSAVEHEEIRSLLEGRHGAAVAEFFDQEGCLPLSHEGYPWPMHQERARLYEVCLFLMSLAAGFGIVLALSGRVSFVVDRVAVAVAGSVVVFYGASPLLALLFRPKDLLRRWLLVDAYEGIVRQHRMEAEGAARQAREARAAEKVSGEGGADEAV